MSRFKTKFKTQWTDFRGTWFYHVPWCLAASHSAHQTAWVCRCWGHCGLWLPRATSVTRKSDQLITSDQYQSYRNKHNISTLRCPSGEWFIFFFFFSHQQCAEQVDIRPPTAPSDVATNNPKANNNIPWFHTKKTSLQRNGRKALLKYDFLQICYNDTHMGIPRSICAFSRWNFCCCLFPNNLLLMWNILPCPSPVLFLYFLLQVS